MEPNCPARSKEGKGITAVNPQAETGFVCRHVFFFWFCLTKTSAGDLWQDIPIQRA